MDVLGEIHSLQLTLSRSLDDSPKSYKEGENQLSQSFKVITSFDQLAGKIYELRRQLPISDPRRIAAEDFFSSFSQSLIALQRSEKDVCQISWLQRYREIWRRDYSIFLFCLVLFVSSTLVGWSFAVNRPEYVTVLMPQGLIEKILDKHAWFSEIQNNPFFAGLEIASNNIRVCISAFALGALLGLGGIYILCYNGVFFGAILGYCWVNGFNDALENFVIGHGPLELSIIIASSFASLLYGRAFFTRPFSEFRNRIRTGAGEAFTIMLGIVPWLIFAAFIEAFVSPFHYLDPTQKFLLGLFAASLFWGWTFWGYTFKDDRSCS